MSDAINDIQVRFDASNDAKAGILSMERTLYEDPLPDEPQSSVSSIMEGVQAPLEASDDNDVEFHFTMGCRYLWMASFASTRNSDGATIGQNYPLRLYPVNRRFVSGGFFGGARLATVAASTDEEQNFCQADLVFGEMEEEATLLQGGPRPNADVLCEQS